MDERDKNEQLIGKLIRKRKEEIDAFQKLLNALDTRKQPHNTKPKENKKPKH